MATHNTTSEPAPLFTARLTPHRSLSPQGFRILMAFVATFCITVGLVFLSVGLWPVTGFLGLDLLLVYMAFRASYRDGETYEDIEVSRQHVSLAHVEPGRPPREFAFPQFGTRFEVDRHEEIGITAMRLANRQESVAFGKFLNPADRETFADEFSKALSSAKR